MATAYRRRIHRERCAVTARGRGRTRLRALTATPLLVLAASLLAIAPAQAASGDLDPTFSGDGKVTTDFDGYDEAHAVALLQPDGKLVVVGRTVAQGGLGWKFALARYNADGSLDPTFSGDGKQTTELGGGNGFARGVAIQPDRKIVVVGHAGEGDYDFAVARYTDDGSLDPSFSADGKLLTDMTGYTDTASDVTIDPDGRIVVVGRAGDDFGVARYTADGTLDTTFSDDGRQTTHLGPGYASDGAEAVAIQGDGKLVLAGTTDTLPPCDFSIDVCEDPFADFALVRYNADGTLDTAFSDDGKQITTDFAANAAASAVALAADGKIVTAGYDGGDFALARYNSDGTLDDSFAGDGTQTTDFDGTRNDLFGVGDEASGVALQPDGKIVAVGEGNLQFGLARYNPDGSLDASFSGDGKQTTEFGGSATASGVVLQPDGKIVAAGTIVGAGGVFDVALARYEGGSASGTAPTNSSPPTISGTATDGQTLTVNAGAWTGSSPINHGYQWRRCDSTGANCVDIAAATATTYALAAADVGHTIRARETATNPYGQNSADSAPSAVVTPKPGAIVGTVRNAKNAAKIANAIVNCGNGYSAKTASDGRYSIPNVASGTYNCTASASGYKPSTRTVAVGSGQTVTADFSLIRQ